MSKISRVNGGNGNPLKAIISSHKFIKTSLNILIVTSLLLIFIVGLMGDSTIKNNSLIRNNNLDIKKRYRSTTDNVANDELTLPKLNISTILTTEESGIISPELLHSDNSPEFKFLDEQSDLTLIESSLQSLQVEKKATGENIFLNSFWKRENIGYAGPKRLDGFLANDTQTVLQGESSTKFTVLTNTSLNWYSDFQLPGWRGDKFPSIFNHNNILSGAFKFTPSPSLMNNEYGFNNWLRIRFNNSYYGLNIALNRSSGLIDNNSAVYKSQNQDFAINIVLESYDENNFISVWSENDWVRFAINVTGILNQLFPIDSSLRLNAESLFSNITMIILDLESFAFIDGSMTLWVDDLHWISSLSEQEISSWEEGNNLFKTSTESSTEDLSDLGKKYNWMTNRSQKLVGTNEFSFNSLESFGSYIPTFFIKKISYYYQSDSLELFSDIDNSFSTICLFTFNSSNNAITELGLKSVSLSKPDFFFKLLNKPDSFINSLSGYNYSYSFNLNHFLPFNANLTTSIMNKNVVWTNNDQNFLEIEDFLLDYLFNRSDVLDYFSNIFYSSKWSTNTKRILDFHTTNQLSSLTFFDSLFQSFPSITLNSYLPNLFYPLEKPSYFVYSSGIEIKVFLNSLSLWNNYEFQSEILTQTWKKVTSHGLPKNQEINLFIPWYGNVSINETLKLNLLLIMDKDGIGWYSTTFILPSVSLTNQFTSNYGSSNTSSDINNSSFIGENIFSGNFNSKNILIYGFLIGSPLVSGLVYFKRKQRNRVYELLYDE